MTPIARFDLVWERCANMSAMQAYLEARNLGVLGTDEFLRAEWVARVAALDLYVHELVTQRMIRIFAGDIPQPPGYFTFKVSLETVARIRSSSGNVDAVSAFELDVRRQFSFLTFQHPDKIADAIRYCSELQLWNRVALNQGAAEGAKEAKAKQIRNTLAAIVERRNKIAHEADLKPSVPVERWSISQADLKSVALHIEGIVRSIDAVVLI